MKITKKILRDILSQAGLTENIATGQTVIKEMNFSQITIFIGGFDDASLNKVVRVVRYKALRGIWEALPRFKSISFHYFDNPENDVLYDGILTQSEAAKVEPKSEVKIKPKAKRPDAKVFFKDAILFDLEEAGTDTIYALKHETEKYGKSFFMFKLDDCENESWIKQGYKLVPYKVDSNNENQDTLEKVLDVAWVEALKFSFIRTLSSDRKKCRTYSKPMFRRA